MDGTILPARGARVLELEGQPRPYTMRDGEARTIAAQAKALREARRPPEAAEATPEALLRRKKTDVVAQLWREQRLTLEEAKAAAEILRVYSAVVRDAEGCQVASYAPRGDRGIREDAPAALSKAYREHYQPWRTWSGRLSVGLSSTVGDLTLHFVVDNMGPRQVADALKVRISAVIPYLQKSLQFYAATAGWVREFPVFAVRP